MHQALPSAMPIFEKKALQKGLFEGFGQLTSEFTFGGQTWLVQTERSWRSQWSLITKSILILAVCICFSLLSHFQSVSFRRKMTFDSKLLERTQHEIAKATAELSRERNFLQIILDTMPSLVAYWDKDLKNVLHNKASLHFFGKSQQELVGKHISEVLPREIYEYDLPYMKLALMGQAQQIERELKNSKAESRILSIRFIPDEKEGSVNGILIVINDLTELRRLQQQEKENNAAQFYKSRLSLIAEMAGGVAHEINNPLAIILGKTDLLVRYLRSANLSKDVSDKAQSYLDSIQTTISRISSIVNSLQWFSHESDSELFQPVMLKPVFDNFLSLAFERLQKNGINVMCCGLNSNQIAICNKSEIEQVLFNLISNSEQAILNLDEKWVTIDIEEVGNFWQIRVTDSGKGIPDEIVAKMMVPFFTTREVGKGTGLGLSISKGIVEKHKGRLEYQLHDGHTSFVFTVPKATNSNILKNAA